MSNRPSTLLPQHGLSSEGSLLPINELERLRILRLYQILDTAAEQAFDDLTHLAATICEVPIALISLVDEHRQWFKAKVGIGASETARSAAFCAHAILGEEILVVQDALQDQRFASNPLVLGEPKVRFYAGAPLVVKQGISLGTVCVIDQRPRVLNPSQLGALDIIRRTVVGLLEGRRAMLDLKVLTKTLSVCSWCRSVKTEDGNWTEMHKYLNRAVSVTHGICPRCFERELPELTPP